MLTCTYILFYSCLLGVLYSGTLPSTSCSLLLERTDSISGDAWMEHEENDEFYCIPQ
jgi:hypothetical protein